MEEIDRCEGVSCLWGAWASLLMGTWLRCAWAGALCGWGPGQSHVDAPTSFPEAGPGLVGRGGLLELCRPAEWPAGGFLDDQDALQPSALACWSYM